MITVVNIKHYRGPDVVYIGRAMFRFGLSASPLGNPIKRGSMPDEEILWRYEAGLRELLEVNSPQRREIQRLTEMARKGDLQLACWCKQPGREVACHGDVVKKIIEERLGGKA